MISDGEKRTVVESVAKTMKEAYIFPEMREKTGKFIANYTLTADTGGFSEQEYAYWKQTN